MDKQLIALNLNLSLVDKARLYKGKKGQYLSAVLHLSPTTDQYGNHGFIVESITKEERQNGQRGTILGNAKILTPGGENNVAPQVTAYTPPAQSSQLSQSSQAGKYDDDDLPF